MKPHSRTSKKIKPKQSVNQTTPKTQQNSNPKLDNQGLSSRMAHPDTLTPADVLQLQRTIGNQATRHLIQREGDDDKPKGLGGKYSETMAMLENHIGSKAKQRDLLTQDKAGQGMAKDITNQGMDGLLGQQDATASQNEIISKGFQRLVEFSRFDDSANVSVLKSAEDGGLKDDQKWSVVVANSDFMKYIQKGMTINKIIPDHQVKNILGIKHNNEGSGQQSAKGTIAYGGNKVGGSVAHEQNYDGLSGSQSVSNFGLDYGGYTDTDKDGKKVKLQGNEAVDDYTWGGLSSYVKESGDGKLQGVENVFYVKVKIPDKEMDKVKVPIHQNIIDFASQKKAEITGQLASYPALIQQAEENGANITEIIRSLKAKLVILDRFLKYALFSSSMAVSKTLSGDKNPDDPLTNLGITKPSARLQNQFGTVNQEYHIQGVIDLPPDSGLFLKDKSGEDIQVGKFVLKGNNTEWAELNQKLIESKLTENTSFRDAK